MGKVAQYTAAGIMGLTGGFLLGEHTANREVNREHQDAEFAEQCIANVALEGCADFIDLHFAPIEQSVINGAGEVEVVEAYDRQEIQNFVDEKASFEKTRWQGQLLGVAGSMFLIMTTYLVRDVVISVRQERQRLSSEKQPESSSS